MSDLRAADVLREHGHRLVDRMADYLAGVEGRPVSTPRAPAALEEAFREPLPRAGLPAARVWDDAWTRVAEDAIHLAHPMYMGHQVAPPLPHAVLADALASLLNQSLAVAEMSPTGTPVEGQVVRWLAELAGFPEEAEGTLLSGGSAANLTALLAAREARFPGCWEGGVAATPDAARGCVLASAHAHYSVERAAGVLGIGSDAVVAVPERDGRMDPEALDALLRRVTDAGRIPFAVAATAASTATGRFDPLDRIAEVCARAGVWLHVDGAHGASYLLSARHRDRLCGVELADSLTWDPHKMLWMPISAGAVLVREGRHLEAAFRQSAPYLFHAPPGDERCRDTGRMTLQCSRRFDALKLWIALRHYGADHFAALLDRSVERTGSLHRMLSDASDFEPAHAPESNILCFRHLPPGVAEAAPEAQDAFQQSLRAACNASGGAWITTTVLEGRRVLRVTLINPATEDAHLERLLEILRETGRGLHPARSR